MSAPWWLVVVCWVLGWLVGRLASAHEHWRAGWRVGYEEGQHLERARLKGPPRTPGGPRPRRDDGQG